jgi:hypothetical protein
MAVVLGTLTFALGAPRADADPGAGHFFTVNDVAQNEPTGGAPTTDFVFTVTLTNEPGATGEAHVDYVTGAGPRHRRRGLRRHRQSTSAAMPPGLRAGSFCLHRKLA